jgi:hypothetical protein
MEYLDDKNPGIGKIPGRIPGTARARAQSVPDIDESEFMDDTLPENQPPAKPAPVQPPPPVRQTYFRKPVISLPKQGIHIKEYVEANPNKPSVTQMLNDLLEEKKYGEMKKETEEKKKPWRWPYSWKNKAKKASKIRDVVLVFYFTIKGELETFIVPIYGGNMVIIRNKVYEFDPRAVWTIKIGFKWYKLLAIKEIDRRPISNLDLDEIRKRGDSTDSDEFLIKAALKAQIQTAAKAVSRGLIILIAVLVIGGLLFFFFSRK